MWVEEASCVLGCGCPEVHVGDHKKGLAHGDSLLGKRQYIKPGLLGSKARCYLGITDIALMLMCHILSPRL